MTLQRQELRQVLARLFEPQPWALAMWEGGSAAFGRADEFSDLDLQVVVSTDAVEPAFSLLEQELERLGGVALRYRVPEPAWHGQSQCFYQLNDAGPFLMLDVLFIREGSEFKLTELEQHGQPQVLFDKGGHIKVTRLDQESHGKAMAARRETLRVHIPLFMPLIEKEILRGRPIDALGFYQAFAIRPLVELLRMKYDPDKYSFGLRYLTHYLPAEVHSRLVDLAFVADLKEMQGKLLQVKQWCAELLSESGATGD